MIPKTPGFRVLVKPDKLEDFDPVIARAKAAGLELAETEAKNERTAIDTGTILQIGPVAFSDRGGVENWCKVGDRISYARHGGKVVKDPTNHEITYLVLNDEDVCLVWENE